MKKSGTTQSFHICTHPKTRSRRERALVIRRKDLYRLEDVLKRDGILRPLYMCGLSDKEMEKKVERAKADIKNLEAKLGG